MNDKTRRGRKDKVKNKSGKEKRKMEVVPHRAKYVPRLLFLESLKALYHPVISWLAACTYKYSSLWTLLFMGTSCSGKKTATETAWVTLGTWVRVKKSAMNGKDEIAAFNIHRPFVLRPPTHIAYSGVNILIYVHPSVLGHTSNHIYDYLHPTIKTWTLQSTVCSLLKVNNCPLIDVSDEWPSAIMNLNAGQF